MKLRVNKASPFARKARILAREAGLAGRVEEIETAVSPVAPNEDLARENPLIKIPALVMDNGELLYDSAVICEYLDTLHSGRKLFPGGRPPALLGAAPPGADGRHTRGRGPVPLRNGRAPRSAALEGLDRGPEAQGFRCAGSPRGRGAVVVERLRHRPHRRGVRARLPGFPFPGLGMALRAPAPRGVVPDGSPAAVGEPDRALVTMATPGTPTIAVFTKNYTNPAYAAARLGAERTAARLGARVTHYVPRQPDNLEEQIALVELAMADRADAIVFAPVHATAMDDSVRRINAAGIPLVNFINRLATGEVRDLRRLGRCAARARDRAAAASITSAASGDIVVLEGVPGAVSSQDRMRGFQDAVRASPGARIVASRPADYQRETARRVTRELLAAIPRMDGILSANDVMSLGAIDALREAGRSIPLIGVNALPEAVRRVEVRPAARHRGLRCDEIELRCHRGGHPAPARAAGAAGYRASRANRRCRQLRAVGQAAGGAGMPGDVVRKQGQVRVKRS